MPFQCDPARGTANAFIQQHFFDCVYSTRDLCGFCLGMVAIVLWVFAQIPQFLSNYRLQSSEALSVWFLTQWFLGDTLNLLGCLISGTQLPTTTYLAMYFVVADVVMLTQFIYYGALKSRNQKILQRSLTVKPRRHHHHHHHRQPRPQASLPLPGADGALDALPAASDLFLPIRPEGAAASEPFLAASSFSCLRPEQSLQPVDSFGNASGGSSSIGYLPGVPHHAALTSGLDAVQESGDSVGSAVGGSGGVDGDRAAAGGSSSSSGQVATALASSATLSAVVLTFVALGCRGGGGGAGQQPHPGEALGGGGSGAFSRRLLLHGPHQHGAPGQDSGSSSRRYSHLLSAADGLGGGELAETAATLGAPLLVQLAGHLVGPMAAWVVGQPVGQHLRSDEWVVVVGTAIGYVSSVLYLMSRFSQIIKNHTRQSAEGLSVAMFFMAFCGNLCTGSSILLRSQDWPHLKAQLPWVCGTFGTTFLDAIIFAQAFTYGTGAPPGAKADAGGIVVEADRRKSDLQRPLLLALPPTPAEAAGGDAAVTLRG